MSSTSPWAISVCRPPPLLAIMVGIHHWPYWLGLAAALAVGALSGTVVELAVIRRLFRAPRVIVLVATIGVAELAQAVSPGASQLSTGTLTDHLPESVQRPVAASVAESP